MDDDSSVLVRIGSALSGYCVGTVRGFSGSDVTILEHSGSISENKIDGSVNIAVSIELSLGMHVESV